MAKIDIACIIDDDDIYIFGMKKLAKVAGFCNNMLVFKNGEEALKYMKPLVTSTEFPDVILLDINMPVMDGWEFLDEFIKIKPGINKDVTIYMVSSSIHQDDKDKAASYKDVAGYIIKPVRIDDLQRIMQ